MTFCLKWCMDSVCKHSNSRYAAFMELWNNKSGTFFVKKTSICLGMENTPTIPYDKESSDYDHE